MVLLVRHPAKIKLSQSTKVVLGPNGCGKSTVLSKIASRELPVPDCMEILYIEQEAAPEDRVVTQAEALAVGDNRWVQVFEAVLAADGYRRKMLEQLV